MMTVKKLRHAGVDCVRGQAIEEEKEEEGRKGAHLLNVQKKESWEKRS
jgi:hypothetical protein